MLQLSFFFFENGKLNAEPKRDLPRPAFSLNLDLSPRFTSERFRSKRQKRERGDLEVTEWKESFDIFLAAARYTGIKCVGEN